MLFGHIMTQLEQRKPLHEMTGTRHPFLGYHPCQASRLSYSTLLQQFPVCGGSCTHGPVIVDSSKSERLTYDITKENVDSEDHERTRFNQPFDHTWCSRGVLPEYGPGGPYSGEHHVNTT